MGKSREQEDADTVSAQAEQARKASEDENRRRTAEQRKLVDQQKQDMINLSGEQARQGAASGQSQVRKSASSRGMLYSGMRQGGEQAASAGAAQGLSQATQEASQGAESKQFDLNAGGMKSALTSYGQNMSQEQAAYQRRLEEWKTNPAGQIGSALGKIGGAILPF